MQVATDLAEETTIAAGLVLQTSKETSIAKPLPEEERGA
jgi:hypothetical protein